MPIVLARIDDRLVHGQVVIGWGRPLGADLILLVDGEVAASAWEQDIYRMAVPDGMEIVFVSLDEAAQRLPAWAASQSRVLVLTGDVATMAALRDQLPELVREVNIGGLHYRPGREERLRYVYLAPTDAALLRAMAEGGALITAQDLPATTPVPLAALL